MNLILLGMPGSGKGTQAKMISGKYGIPHISTGEIFRGLKGPLADEVGGYVNKGQLVPDEIVFKVVADRLGKDDCAAGYLLDGFPRNLNQAEIFEKDNESGGKQLPSVIYMELSRDVVVKRLSARRNCPECRADYNVVSMPPAKEGICDKCGAKLVSRRDDNEDVIRNRLQVYNDETSPLVEFYTRKKRIYRINADNTVEGIFENICSVLDKTGK